MGASTSRSSARYRRREPIALGALREDEGVVAMRATMAVVVVLSCLVAASTVGADETPAPEWEPTTIATATSVLYASRSGALFATVGGETMRSDDGGTTWTVVPAPPMPPVPPSIRNRALPTVVSDPTNDAVLYATAREGLFKSTSAGEHWEQVFALPDGDQRIISFAVSPADPSLAYLAHAGSGTFRFLRTHDAAVTWEELDFRRPCWGSIYLLSPHPTDAVRVFRALACLYGGTANATLRQSHDRGAQWDELRAGFFYPTRLVGGLGTDPGRWYVAGPRDERYFGGGSEVWASADDGETWTKVASFAITRVGGLAYDPVRPSTLFIAIGSGVQRSDDGGTTWRAVGRQDLPPITDLTLGVDGQRVYAATEAGVFRLPLPRAVTAAPKQVPARP